jgi:hypothetical protein
MRKHYRLTLPTVTGRVVVVNGIAENNAAAIAGAQRCVGVGPSVMPTSLRCEGPVDVDISTPGTTRKRLHLFGFDSRGGVRLLSDSSCEGIDAAAKKYIGVGPDTDHDSYAIHPEVIDFEA